MDKVSPPPASWSIWPWDAPAAARPPPVAVKSVEMLLTELKARKELKDKRRKAEPWALVRGTLPFILLAQLLCTREVGLVSSSSVNLFHVIFASFMSPSVGALLVTLVPTVIGWVLTTQQIPPSRALASFMVAGSSGALSAASATTASAALEIVHVGHFAGCMFLLLFPLMNIALSAPVNLVRSGRTLLALLPFPLRWAGIKSSRGEILAEGFRSIVWTFLGVCITSFVLLFLSRLHEVTLSNPSCMQALIGLAPIFVGITFGSIWAKSSKLFPPTSSISNST